MSLEPGGVFQFGGVVAETQAFLRVFIKMDHDVAVHRFMLARIYEIPEGRAINPIGVGRKAINRFLSGEGMGIHTGVFLVSDAGAEANHLRINGIQKGIGIRGVGAVMTPFEQLDFRQGIPGDELVFSIRFEIAREQEVLLALAEEDADRIVVFVVTLIFVIIVIEDAHAESLAEVVAAAGPAA